MSNSRTWIVREATSSDDVALAELFEVVFGFCRSANHCRWKFINNPCGAPVTVVAEDRGKVVGQYALWPVRMRLGCELVNGAQSLDTMTLPEYRGQGMFTVLAEECMRYAAARGIEVLYGFPNENSYPGFVRKLNWDCTGDIPIWVRPLNVGKHQRVPRWAAPIANSLVRMLPNGSREGYDIVIRAPSVTELESLLEVGRENRELCRIERSADYFAWRFSSESAMGYCWVSAFQKGELKAFGVWGKDIRNGNALLAELLGHDLDAARAVLAVIVGQAGQAGCPLMLAVSNRATLFPVMRGAGFIRRGGIPLIVRKLTSRTLGANVHTHSCWDVFGADLDTF